MNNTNSLPPKFIVRSLQTFRSWVLAIHDRVFPQQLILYELFQTYYLLPALAIVAELNIAALLQQGKQPVESLAMACKVDTESLYRILRALASRGIFKERPARHFSLTTRAKSLIDQHPSSLRNMFRHHLSPLNWSMMGDLIETVKTGKDGLTRHYGQNIYDYLKDYPEQYAVFDQSMAELTTMGLSPILQSYSFKGIAKLVDIGGGNGILLANICMRYPSIQGFLFDVPEALTTARNTFARHQVENRITCLEGSFFESIPLGMDAYLLKNILHNWDDLQCIQLLTRLNQSMPDHAKLIIIEMIIPRGNRPSTAKLIDIQMLATMPGGKERTVEAYDHLCREAGLTISHIYSTISPVSVLEARKTGTTHEV